MSQFETSKNKLRKLWEDIVSNTNDIDSKSDIDQLSFFNKLLKQQYIKTPIEIYNSGDIFLVPELIDGATTAIKEISMPTEVSYSQLIDLEIPEIFLPFVKYSVEVKPVPTAEVYALNEYIPSTWEGDNIRIEGDGKLIYKSDIDGISPSLIGSFDGSYTLPTSFFTENNINLDMTKRVWDATIIKDEGGAGGNVTRIVAIISAGESFTVNAFINPDHEISNLTSTSFTAIGDYVDLAHSIDLPNVERTYTFSSLDSYNFLLNESTTVLSEDIESQEFEEIGRWLYWSDLLQKSFVLEIKSAQDGDQQIIEIQNLPDTDDSDTLPYTSITLQRNLETATSLPSVQKDEESSIISGEREFKNYVKINESNASVPKFRFKLAGEFIVSSPAIVLDSDTIDFPIYNDIYTVVGSSYSLTTENHSLLSKEIWFPETQDIILNIKAYLINPLHWREQRRYK